MEFVYVVPREALFAEPNPQGFVPFGPQLNRTDLLACIETHGFFVERARAEQEPRWKQIIPYALVTHGPRILLLERTKRGGDARLHGKLSLGVGGHLEPIDGLGAGGHLDRGAIPARGALRELHEELVLEAFEAPQELGLINDDSNPVGAVHLGLVLRLEARVAPSVREQEVLKGRLVDLQELRTAVAAGANLESWSSLLLPLLEGLLGHSVRPGTPALKPG